MSEEAKNKAIEIYESYYYLMPTSLSENKRNETAIKCAENDVDGIIEFLKTANELNMLYRSEKVVFYQEVKNQIKSI